MLRTLYGKPRREGGWEGGAGSIILLIFLQPSSVGEGWWGSAESLVWGQLKLHLFHVDQFIPGKVLLFLYCHVFLLPRFPFHFISFRFPPSFVENKTETTCPPAVFRE